MNNVVEEESVVTEQAVEQENVQHLTEVQDVFVEVIEPREAAEQPAVENPAAEKPAAESPVAQMKWLAERAAQEVEKPVLVTPVTNKIEPIFVRKELLRGLLKLKPVLPEKPFDQLHRFIHVIIRDADAILRASNGSVTVDVTVPLYEYCPSAGVFAVVGEELFASVRHADNLIRLSADTSSGVCTMSSGRYTCYLHAIEGFKLGDDFKVPNDPNLKPFEVERDVFLKGLQVGATAMANKNGIEKMQGIAFGPTSVQATDGNKIAILRNGTGSGSFTVPEDMVEKLERLLVHGRIDSANVRANAHQVEVTLGETSMVFRQMADCVQFDAVTAKLETFQALFMVDKESFLLGLARVKLCEDKTTVISLSRLGDELKFTATQGARTTVSGSIPVTWHPSAPPLEIKIDADALKRIIDAVQGNIINCGSGTIMGTQFLRLDEDDRSLFVLNTPR